MKDVLSEITICPMTADDLDDVLAIEAASFPAPWNREHFIHELDSSYSFPLVAFSGDGRLAGYICPMVVLDEGHILDVAVHPDLRGHGVGKLLVEMVLKDCRERGAAFVSLEVRLSNKTAIELYRQLGFDETGYRRRYYENGEDALLMEYLYSKQGAENAI